MLRAIQAAIVTCILGNVYIVAAQGQDESSPLQLELSTTTTMLCIGSSLPLEMEITNRGREEMKIDKFDLWSSFAYGFSRADGSGRGGGEGSSCDSCRGNYIRLMPSQSVRSAFNYGLAGDFFEEPGQYTFKVNYDNNSTNAVSFELYDCNPN